MSTERRPIQDTQAGETARILAGLGIAAVNPGAFSGSEWHAAADAPLIDSVNPATGEVIARVRAAGPGDYERIMKSAAAAFAAWREVPAPRRGEAVRLVGEAREPPRDAKTSLQEWAQARGDAEGCALASELEAACKALRPAGAT